MNVNWFYAKKTNIWPRATKNPKILKNDELSSDDDEEFATPDTYFTIRTSLLTSSLSSGSEIEYESAEDEIKESSSDENNEEDISSDRKSKSENCTVSFKDTSNVSKIDALLPC